MQTAATIKAVVVEKGEAVSASGWQMDPGTLLLLTYGLLLERSTRNLVVSSTQGAAVA